MATDSILIEGFKLDVVIGAFHWERQIKQPIILDLILSVNIDNAINTDDLVHTVNYKSVVDDIKQFLEVNHFQLIETAASQIIDLIFNHFDKVDAVDLTLRKPLALYKQNVQNVGVKMQRSRPNN